MFIVMSSAGSGGRIRYSFWPMRPGCALFSIGAIEFLPLIAFASPKPVVFEIADPKLGMQRSVFLTAEWRYLAMLNYVVDPDLLQPLVPPGTELDFFGDQTFLSIVGFRFLRTRVFGIAFPRYRHFEEVNLRFYVRRRTDTGWRRGVVFIRELVPRRAIAFIARTFYGEPYVAVPMRHQIEESDSRVRVEYGWKRDDAWESIRAIGIGQPQPIESGSEEEFITEHYWGYTALNDGSNEYQVEHPRWRVWRCSETAFIADIASLYGECFVESLSVPPASAFIADGSPIIVRRYSRLVSAQTEPVTQ
jgi:uncharacterized protein